MYYNDSNYVKNALRKKGNSWFFFGVEKLWWFFYTILFNFYIFLQYTIFFNETKKFSFKLYNTSPKTQQQEYCLVFKKFSSDIQNKMTIV